MPSAESHSVVYPGITHDEIGVCVHYPDVAVVVVGMVVAIVCGYFASLFFPAPDPERTDRLSWKWYGFKEMFFGGERDTIDIN